MKQTEGGKLNMKLNDWGEGPWQDEPDRVEFEAHGFPCLMVRQPSGGHWCGYVAVPPCHPWHGKGFDNVEAAIHGGLTYSSRCQGGVCHVPKPGEPDNVWWLGFDCAHFGDFSPGYFPFGRVAGPYETYRSAVYVQRECEELALQAREAAGGAA